MKPFPIAQPPVVGTRDVSPTTVPIRRRLLARLARWIVLGATLVSGSMLLTSPACKPDHPTECDTCNIAPPPLSAKVLAFAQRHATLCNARLIDLDLVFESTGYKDSNDARSFWRAGRKEYELVRFLVSEYLPAEHAYIAAWFTVGPYVGFHFVEKDLFENSPNLETGTQNYFQLENLITGHTTGLASTLSAHGIADDGIFKGLQYSIADMDSLKLSGMDSAWSKNSYNDLFTNLAAIDSVYGFYADSVQVVAPAADSTLKARVAAAREMLTAAGSISAVNKAAFRAALVTLQDALRAVAIKFDVTLP